MFPPFPLFLPLLIFRKKLLLIKTLIFFYSTDQDIEMLTGVIPIETKVKYGGFDFIPLSLNLLFSFIYVRQQPLSKFFPVRGVSTLISSFLLGPFFLGVKESFQSCRESEKSIEKLEKTFPQTTIVMGF